MGGGGMTQNPDYDPELDDPNDDTTGFEKPDDEDDEETDGE